MIRSPWYSSALSGFPTDVGFQLPPQGEVGKRPGITPCVIKPVATYPLKRLELVSTSNSGGHHRLWLQGQEGVFAGRIPLSWIIDRHLQHFSSYQTRKICAREETELVNAMIIWLKCSTEYDSYQGERGWLPKFFTVPKMRREIIGSQPFDSSSQIAFRPDASGTIQR